MIGAPRTIESIDITRGSRRTTTLSILIGLSVVAVKSIANEPSSTSTSPAS